MRGGTVDGFELGGLLLAGEEVDFLGVVLDVEFFEEDGDLLGVWGSEAVDGD